MQSLCFAYAKCFVFIFQDTLHAHPLMSQTPGEITEKLYLRILNKKQACHEESGPFQSGLLLSSILTETS